MWGWIGGAIGLVVGVVVAVAATVSAVVIAPIAIGGAIIGIVACATNFLGICPPSSTPTPSPIGSFISSIFPTPGTPGGGGGGGGGGGTTGGGTVTPPVVTPTVTPPPPTSEVSLSDSSYNRKDKSKYSTTAPGVAYTIVWASHNVSSCTVTQTDPNNATTAFGTGANGSNSASPAVLGTYIYKASCLGRYGQPSDRLTHLVGTSSNQNANFCITSGANSCGMHGNGLLDAKGVCSATVPPDSACGAPNISPSTGFYVDPDLIKSGSQTTLHWTATNATSCSIRGGSLSLANLGITGSTLSGAVTQKTIYTLTCINRVGGQSASAEATVNMVPAFQEI